MQQYTTFPHLPMPDEIAQAHSNKLIQFIQNYMKQRSGRISFAEYMQLALYAPGLGYYSAGAQKFGKEGDFVTAPEISSLFGKCVAEQCKQVFSAIGQGDILELGAGSGKLAADILLALQHNNALPEHYYILEVSADLKERQQTYLAQACPFYYERIRWLDHLPGQPFKGVILANEVLDAMPVELFRITDVDIQQAYVKWKQQQFEIEWDKPIDKLQQTCEELLFNLPEPLPHGYQSEISLILSDWMSSIADCLYHGVMLVIDYGFLANEYYHPKRHMGTLMCHYRHFAHDNPFLLCGLQDITAHVDFSRVAESAMNAGMQVLGFVSQAQFLLSCGLLNLIPEQLTTAEQLSITQQIKILTLPSEMGELFKVMALGKKVELPLQGFIKFRSF